MMKRIILPSIILLSAILSQLTWAIDNPDTPDYVAQFESRIEIHEDYIANKASTTVDFGRGYGELYNALDKELNIAYKQLLATLSKPDQESLRASQRQWLKYRDAEYEFIGSSITRDKFGSSAVMSAGAHRTSVLKARVIELLWYLKLHS